MDAAFRDLLREVASDALVAGLLGGFVFAVSLSLGWDAGRWLVRRLRPTNAEGVR